MQIIQDGKEDWRFERRATDARLNAAERFVMATLFQSGYSVSTDDLKHEKYADLLTKDARTRPGRDRARLVPREPRTAMRAVQGS